MPKITDKVPAEKRDVLLRALGAPDMPASQKVISKAAQRGWVEDSNVTGSLRPSEAIGRSIEEGASLGLAKTGRAVSGGLFEALNPEPEQADKPFGQRFSEAFKKEKEQEFKRVEELGEAFPKTTMAGNIAGSVIPLAPSFAGALPAVITGVLAGAISSAAEGEDARGIAKGSAIGGGGAALGVGVGKMLGAAAKSLRNLSQETLAKSLKLPPTVMRRLRIKGDVLGKARGIADDVLEQGVAKNPVTLDRMYKNTSKVLKRVGEEVGESYKVADDILPNAFSKSEVDRVIADALRGSQKFTSADDIAKFVEKTTKGLGEQLPKSNPLGKAVGSVEGKAKPSQIWEFIKELDKTSRQFTRSSDPTFASKADALSDAANSLRNALLNKIAAADDQVAKKLAENSALYRSMATVEDSLGDQVIREFSANRSIPRQTVFDAIKDLLPTNVAATGGAKGARGLAGVLEQTSKAAPAGVAGKVINREQ